MKLIILQACGAKYYIKGELLDEIDVDDVVVALVFLAGKSILQHYHFLYGYLLF